MWNRPEPSGDVNWNLVKHVKPDLEEPVVEGVWDEPNELPKPVPWVQTEEVPEKIPPVSCPDGEVVVVCHPWVDTVSSKEISQHSWKHWVPWP